MRECLLVSLLPVRLQSPFGTSFFTGLAEDSIWVRVLLCLLLVRLQPPFSVFLFFKVSAHDWN